MTDTAAAADLLDELTLMPYGPAHRERATQVVAIAQERGDKGLEFDARMRLTDEGAMRGVADLALANFAWCAAAYKDDASLVTGDATRAQSFFWQHKWMPGILTGSPAFDRTQIDAVLDDMEATFRDAGLGLSAVASARFETATSLGDLADAERLGEDLESLPRDDYSSCEACIPAGYVDLELLRRDGAAAAQIAISAWREHQVCAHEPETMLARTLVAMLESGRLEDAAEAFDFVCRSSRTEPDKLLNMALAAQFASLTGHHDLALDLVERHVGWLAHDALHERAHFTAALAFAVVLERYVACGGSADAVVRASADPALAAVLPAVDEPRTVADLGRELWALGEGLAQRFDERGGNDLYAREVAWARALVERSWEVPLTQEVFAPVSIRRAAPTTTQEWFAAAVAANVAYAGIDAIEAATHVLASADAHPVQRLRAAAIRAQHAGAMGDMATVEASHEAYMESANVLGEATVRLAAIVASEAGPAELAAAATEHADAVPSTRARALVRSASESIDLQLRSEEGMTEEAFAWAMERLDEAEVIVAPDAVAGLDEEIVQDAAFARYAVLATRGTLLGRIGAHDDAIAVFAAAEAALPGRAVTASVAGMRAKVREAAQDPVGAGAEHDRAATEFAAAGFGGTAAFAAFESGRCAILAGDAERAAARFDYGAGLWGTSEPLPFAVRWDYAQALLATGEADRARELAESVLEHELAQPQTSPGSLAQTRVFLAQCMAESGDQGAGEQYAAAARLFVEDGAVHAGAEASLRAAQFWCGRYQADLALPELVYMESLLEREPEQFLTLALLDLRAECMADADDPAWREVLQAARAHGASLDDRDPELRFLLRVSDWLRLIDEYAVAAGVLADAAPLARGLEEDFIWVEVQARLAGVLFELEDTAGADAALAAVRDRAAELDADVRGYAAERGAGVLSDWGRDDEEEAWWELFED